MTRKPERSAVRSIGLVGLVNIGTAIVGVLQAFVVGRIFGTTSSIEIYFAAAVFYTSIVNLMQTGQIAEVFTPIYHRLKESDGAQTAFSFLSVLTNWMVLIAVGFSFLVFMLAEYLVPLTVPGFEDARMATCVTMFRWIVPLVAAQIIQSLFSTLLAAEKRFVSQEICRLVCMIAGLLTVIFFSSQYDAWVMVAALWLTSLMTLGLFLVCLYRLGYRHSFRFSHPDFSVGAVFKSTPSISVYVVATQIYSIALTAGVSMLPQGSLAVFSYARKIAGRINGVLLRPISVVFFNHYSSALAAGDVAVSKLATRAFGITLCAASFAAISVLASGYPGLRAIWLSDKFSESAVLQTYLILSVLCVVPFFSGLGVIFRKINMSHGLVQRQYFYISIIQLLSAALAYLLISPWGLTGAVVVAVANPVLITMASGVLLRTKAPAAFCTYQGLEIAKCICMLVLSVSPVLLLQNYVYTPSDGLLTGRFGDLCLSVMLLLAGVVIAMTSGLLLKVEEVQALGRFGLNSVWRRGVHDMKELP